MAANVLYCVYGRSVAFLHIGSTNVLPNILACLSTVVSIRKMTAYQLRAMLCWASLLTITVLL